MDLSFITSVLLGYSPPERLTPEHGKLVRVDNTFLNIRALYAMCLIIIGRRPRSGRRASA